MSSYNKFVFDTVNKKYVGDFENLYKNELILGYDAWQQEDLRHIQRVVILNLLNLYNFDIIFDIGSGKGVLTHLLKKKNNKVFGIDISKTANEVAKIKYPDVDWICEDVSKDGILEKLYKNKLNKKNKYKNILTLYVDILSYLKNWKELIKITSSYSNYILISLYLPKEPIGFVKSFRDLEFVLEKFFNIEEIISFRSLETNIIFGKNMR